MLGSVARAGRHAASARPIRTLPPLRLINSTRHSHGASALSTEQVKDVDPLGFVPAWSGSNTREERADDSTPPEETTINSNEKTHPLPSFPGNKQRISTGRQTKVNRHVESIKARRERERELRLEQDGMNIREWPEVMNLLQANLPRNPKRNHRRTMFVKIPMQAERTYKHSPRTVFTEILLKFNCVTRLVHIYSAPVDGELVARYVVLRGPPSTIDAARAYLYSVYNTLVPVQAAEAKSVSKSPNARTVFSSFESNTHDSNVTLDSIHPPEEMTVISFAHYIDRLIGSRPSRLALKSSRKTSGSQPSQHFQQVAEHLVKLFKNYELRSCWSLYAAVATLQFLGKHRLLPAQRQVFQELQEAQEIKSPEIFSAMLEAAAKAQDLKSFKYIVNLMITAGFRPGWEVWVSFVRLTQRYDADVADAILKAMKDSGFLESPAVRVQMAETMCEQHYTEWIESGGTTDMFAGIYDRLWDGARWFTHSSCHSMLTYHAQRGQFESALGVLQSYKHAGGRYTSAHLEVLLRNARKHSSLKSAMAAVDEIVSRQPSLILGQRVYEDLFMTAMKQCYLNVACAVWQTAFAGGHITFAMQKRLEKCFYLSKKQEATHEDEVATGQQDQDTEVPTRTPFKSLRSEFDTKAGRTMLALMVEVQRSYPDADLDSMTPGSEARPSATRPYAQMQLLRQSLDSPQRYKVANALPALLQEAYTRDTDSRRKRVMPSLEEVLRVDLKPIETQVLAERGARGSPSRTDTGLTDMPEHEEDTVAHIPGRWDAEADDPWADEHETNVRQM